MTGRILPNLQTKTLNIRVNSLPGNTHGLTSQAWWLFFRRDLDQLNIRRMNSRQWAEALRLGYQRLERPWKAAEMVAALR